MTQTLDVRGMSCGGCETNVEAALADVPGVTDVEADHELDAVTVEGSASPEDLVVAVEDAGYEAGARPRR